MSNRLAAVLLVLLAFLPAACLKNNRKDVIRPVPADAEARGTAPARPQLPSPLAPPPATLPETAPVVKLPSAEAAPLLAPPAMPAADPVPLKTEPVSTTQTPAASVAGTPQVLYQRAADRFAKITDYESRLVRREVVGGKEGPTEELQFQFRKQPFSVYMKSVGEAGRGREVLYVQGKFEDKMHVVTGEGDNRLVGAGFRTSVKPDSPLATSKSRRKITEAGVGSVITRVGKVVEAGRAKPLGAVQRKEYPYPLEAMELTIKAGDDPSQPAGGRQVVFFDPNPESGGYGLPVLAEVFDPAGKLVEYYCADRIKVNPGLTDKDFNPDRLKK